MGKVQTNFKEGKCRAPINNKVSAEFNLATNHETALK
jgi:hypothetical protein